MPHSVQGFKFNRLKNGLDERPIVLALIHVHPSGVGKTSVARSIARALNRKVWSAS